MEVIKAYAKVNLALDVIKKRNDGYHELSTLMHTLHDVYDDVIIIPDRDISVTFSVPMPHDNTVRKALLLYNEATGKTASVHVVKRIPMQAGMGGGSSDAASTLIGINNIYKALTQSELMLLASKIGSDVPFFFAGGAAVCYGRGEMVMPIVRRELTLKWKKPTKGISTAELFSRLKFPLERANIEAATEAYTTGDIKSLGMYMANSLESEAFKMCPECMAIKHEFIRSGAMGAVLTGSGSAVIGLFD